MWYTVLFAGGVLLYGLGAVYTYGLWKEVWRLVVCWVDRRDPGAEKREPLYYTTRMEIVSWFLAALWPLAVLMPLYFYFSLGKKPKMCFQIPR